jgi:hypothetical protein
LVAVSGFKKRRQFREAIVSSQVMEVREKNDLAAYMFVTRCRRYFPRLKVGA